MDLLPCLVKLSLMQDVRADRTDDKSEVRLSSLQGFIGFTTVLGNPLLEHRLALEELSMAASAIDLSH